MDKVLKVVRRLFTVECRECGEAKVWAWKRRCSFCGKGEGVVR